VSRPKVEPEIEKRIRSRLQAGLGILEVGRERNVGTSVVQRIREEMR
jgi:hypothetical protein